MEKHEQCWLSTAQGQVYAHLRGLPSRKGYGCWSFSTYSTLWIGYASWEVDHRCGPDTRVSFNFHFLGSQIHFIYLFFGGAGSGGGISADSDLKIVNSVQAWPWIFSCYVMFFRCIYHEALCVLSFSFGHSFDFIVVPGGHKLSHALRASLNGNTPRSPIL